MRYAFLGDPRSSNLKDFISSILNDGDSYFIVSPFFCNSPNCYQVFSLFSSNSSYSKTSTSPLSSSTNILALLLSISLKSSWFSLFAYRFLYFLRICELPFYAIQCAYILSREKYDLVFAYRTQVEGYVASLVVPGKYILFTQGSDFIFWALKDPLHYLLTIHTLKFSRGVFTDCTRDLSYALSFTKKQNKNFLVIPGNGGLSLNCDISDVLRDKELSIVCIRPPAPYIDHLTLFKALALLKFRLGVPDFKFYVIANSTFYSKLENQALSVGLDRTDLSLMPLQSKSEFLALLRKCAIAISPSKTDGIPVSILEAVLSGCFPIAENLSSLKDVIVHGENGFLYPAGDHVSLAFYILRSLLEADLRFRAFVYTNKFVLPAFARQLVSRKVQYFINEMMCH